MKKLLKKGFNRVTASVLDEIELEHGMRLLANEVVAQKNLMQSYRLLAARGKEYLPAFHDVGFRKYSQFEEDGILLYLFTLIPPINRKCVELCAGDGRECMTANLIINHGWWGFLFDGNPANVKAAQRFYSNSRDTFFHAPKVNHAWVTAENVNLVIEQAGCTGLIDLLSLDIDGMDYWVWKAIDTIDPRIVVLEIHNMIPPELPLTVPYDPRFICSSEHYRGASLAAMSKLGREKGYRLVGVHRFGFNAFFVKNGIGEEYFPEVSVESCLDDSATRKVRSELWPEVSKLKWERV